MTATALRTYQENTIQATRDMAIQGKNRALIVLPTGAGKTTVAAEMIRRMIMHGRSVLFGVHRQELAYQAKNRFLQFNIPCGIEMAQQKGSHMPVTVASVQTLLRRPFISKDIVFVDEAHHSVSNSYMKILKPYIDANRYVYGLTATPYRLDRKTLGLVYQDVVSVTSNRELIKQGHLVEARYFAAQEAIDMKDVHTLGGDYNPQEMFMAANKDVLYKNLVENYMKYCPNMERAIVFNATKEHSKITAQKFIEAGVPAMHLDCDVKSSRRMEILEMFAAGVYKVICNVSILTEGYDLPAVHAIILNKLTKSRCLYMQMIGRALRPSEYKEHAIVIDHSTNVLDHGFIEDEDEFEYDIHKMKKKGPKKDAPAKVCPGMKDGVPCEAILHAAIMECPRCGYVFPTREKEEKEGEFTEIVKLDFRKTKIKIPLPVYLRKPYISMTRDELIEVAEIRSYKKGWIWNQLERQKNTSSPIFN